MNYCNNCFFCRYFALFVPKNYHSGIVKIQNYHCLFTLGENLHLGHKRDIWSILSKKWHKKARPQCALWTKKLKNYYSNLGPEGSVFEVRTNSKRLIWKRSEFLIIFFHSIPILIFEIKKFAKYTPNTRERWFWWKLKTHTKVLQMFFFPCYYGPLFWKKKGRKTTKKID